MADPVIQNIDPNQSYHAVETLFIGGGPATLGVLVNAVRNQRFKEMLTGRNIAVVEMGNSFGGGQLQNYGIRSNTSAQSFLHLLLRQKKKPKGR